MDALIKHMKSLRKTNDSQQKRLQTRQNNQASGKKPNKTTNPQYRGRGTGNRRKKRKTGEYRVLFHVTCPSCVVFFLCMHHMHMYFDNDVFLDRIRYVVDLDRN